MTLARTLTDTFAGIAPASVVPFIAAQFIGALAATALARWFYPALTAVALVAADYADGPKGAR